MTFWLTRPGFFVLAILSLLYLGACSTGMSKEECAVADWHQIGFEDGSVGNHLNYIARHRKSCSKAGIAPDFNAYKRGHAEGVRQWCNYDNGLRFGESGGRYQGICPADREAAFLDGYDYGRRLYEARSLVANIRNDINSSVNRIAQLEDERISLGELIIDSNTSDVDRVKSVARITEIGDEITDLELYISDREVDLRHAEAELQRVRP